MKKFMLTGAVLCVALAFNSCGTKESAFKKMYEKAKTEEQTGYNVTDTQTANDTPVVAPLEEKPANETNVVDNYDNVSVRQENVSVVDGSGLQAYSVVVGSFSVKANAQGLQQRLKSAGYNAQLAYNADRNMLWQQRHPTRVRQPAAAIIYVLSILTLGCFTPSKWRAYWL